MTTYERVVGGEVVEAVTPIDGSHEDTRLGVLVLEGKSEWRVKGAAQPTPAQNNAPASPPPASQATETPESADSAPNVSTAGMTPSEEPDGAATTDGDGAGTDRNKPRGGRQRG